MNNVRDVCKIEIQIELNKRMFEKKIITSEIYHKVNEMLVKKLAVIQ